MFVTPGGPTNGSIFANTRKMCTWNPRKGGAGPASAERGGFLATKSCSERTCTVECTQIVKDNVCTFNNGSPGQVEKEMANICDTYLAQVKKQLTTFWQDQLLDVVKIWEKYGQQAQDKLDSTTCEYTMTHQN